MVFTLQKYDHADLSDYDTETTIDTTIYALEPDAQQFEEKPIIDLFDEKQLKCLMDFLEFCSKQNELDSKSALGNLEKLKRIYIESEKR
ncbi:hypothetical protein LNTAR_06489 [Lentisphaera araneosa HTCC2155]|uniref:Uncharacterized protein n=1 Tax=Lentisphaera araneosa HTCC2155 TaxID=313628 RepID=A6DNC4_9BACT|nr:hypothetical protein LNTAR_06489 [Lentisphaera araneosa HTCC2155]